MHCAHVAAHFHLQIHSTQAVTTNEIRPKGLKHSMRKRCVTCTSEANPITKPTITVFLFRTKLHPVSTSLFTFTHTQWNTSCGCISDSVVKVTSFLCICVKVRDRGACVQVHMHAQFLSLACHLLEIDGEKCLTRRKPVRCFKARVGRVENMQFYVFV